MKLPHDDLAAGWAAARLPAAVLHLDHAACSRVSRAVLDVQTAHLRAEVEIGGYAAAAAAEPALLAGRIALGQLLGLGPDAIALTESAQAALASLLGSWRGLGPGSRVAVGRSEYGPSVAWLVDHGCVVLDLPTGGEDTAADGAVDLAALPAWFDRERPDLVVLTHLGSQRGLVQPAAAVVAAAHAAHVPVIVDVAQSLGHLRCDDLGADAYVATSRKWLAGPRGVGIVALAPAAQDRLALLAPALGPRWQPDGASTVDRLGSSEAHVAGRLGLAVAAVEHRAAGPARIRERLAALGVAAAGALAVAGWRPAPGQAGSAIVALAPPAGLDVAAVRAALMATHGVLTTCAGPERAPRDTLPALLRFSPHVEATEADLERAATALAAVTRSLR